MRQVKSNVGHCMDFLEHRSITTLGRCVQKSPHRDHVLNMLSIDTDATSIIMFLDIGYTIVCFLCRLWVDGRRFFTIKSMRDISNGWVASDDRNIFVYGRPIPLRCGHRWYGHSCNIDLQLVPVCLVKSGAGIYVKFLEYRFITTLRRHVQKTWHTFHILNMLCLRYLCYVHHSFHSSCGFTRAFWSWVSNWESHNAALKFSMSTGTVELGRCGRYVVIADLYLVVKYTKVPGIARNAGDEIPIWTRVIGWRYKKRLSTVSELSSQCRGSGRCVEYIFLLLTLDSSYLIPSTMFIHHRVLLRVFFIPVFSSRHHFLIEKKEASAREKNLSSYITSSFL